MLLTGQAKGLNRERAFALYCEALREGGLLVAVFASLDAWFSPSKVGLWTVLWILFGLGMLFTGVRMDPEVRRK